MNTQPPKWAERFLTWYCHEDAIEDIQGDLYELYYHRLATEGKSRADIKYAWEVLRFFRLRNFRNPLSKMTIKDITKSSGTIPVLWHKEHVISSNWNDVLFETRNREYGAYVVRRDYSRNLFTGFLASMVLLIPVALVLFWFIMN